MYPVLIVALVAVPAAAVAADDTELLLHYTFDADAGGECRDASDNDLHGAAGGSWIDSPSGRALAFDGTADTALRLAVPEELCFGKKSWSFSAWLRPSQLAIDDRQNQRRIFSFGAFPSANMVIDLTAAGVVTSYFCYTTDDDTTVSASASSALRMAENEWAHVGLVCDRDARTVCIYVNGYCGGPAAVPTEFDGDYVSNGELTIGSSWHNYWGAMDEVRVYRRTLSKQEVKDEFHARREVFGVHESPLAVAAERREAAEQALAQANEAWRTGDFAAAREHCLAVVAAEHLEPQFRSYAHLRAAQSCVAEGRPSAARDEYARIAAEGPYPRVHRMEAGERIRELERLAEGLPPRDPAASRLEVPPVTEFAAEVFVAPDGDDADDGTRERPLASLGAARERVRGLKAGGTTGAIAVQIRPGRYDMTATLSLSEDDSGSEGAPIVYRADGDAPVVLYGGVRLRGFRTTTDPAVLRRLPEEARGHVVECDLKALGIDDYGQLSVRGFAQPPASPTLELYVDQQPMTLARWPNEGFVGIANLVTPGSKPDGVPSVFEYISDRHGRWTQAEDPWLFGYFKFLWADATARIDRIDTKARTITTAEAYHYGGGMSTQQGIQYYAFNLLEEIDAPGEWYVNRATGMLYLYPPSDPDASTIEIGLFSSPMVTMEGVSHVRLEGLTFDLGRYRGLVLQDCTDCVIAGCTVSRMADNGIVIHGGRRNVLLGCDVHTIGRRATEVIGGDRKTLTPGEHVVENCRIYNCGRIDRTYTPCIQLEGVGNRVAHNLLYDCPSSVMRIEGNDHVIEYNEIHSAVRESDDQGAIDIFRNATYRGVVFRHNFFHHVGKTGPGAAVHGQAGLRLDDAISGMIVYGNIFYRSANGNFGAIQMNSGRDNIIDNNVFADCKQGISGGYRANNNVWRQLREGNPPDGFYINELYISRYPEMARMMDQPALNFVWRNVFYRCGRVATRVDGLELFENGVFAEDDPGFVDAPEGDFRLRPDARLFETVGFRPIPVDEIGLYEDEYRASWPVAAPPVGMPDWREDATH